MQRRGKISKFLWLIVVTLVIVVFSFPDIYPDYGPGLDPSYQWGLNWLFVNDYDTLISLIYPLGPLAFLKMPTYEGANFILSFIFYILLKSGFVVLGLMASGMMDKTDNKTDESNRTYLWLVPSGLLFLASYFANIDVLIIFNCLFLSLIHIRQKKWWAFAAGATLATLSLFIKLSIGVNALSVIAICTLIYGIVHKKPKVLALQLAILLCATLLVSFIILHTPTNVIDWYTGTFNLIFGYGSLNTYYHNHVIYLLIFFLTLIAGPFICKNIYARYSCLMLMIPLFVFWKHGMIREDCWHYFWMVYFIIVYWLILALLEERRKPHILLLGVFSLLSLLLNASEMDGYNTLTSKEFCGIKNLTDPLFHYNKYISNAEEYTTWRLQESQLPDSMLQIIGRSSIDIYPYEFSYAAQNHLNWQPRAALGTALSPWLETKSAQNFSEKDEAVRFVLWHFQQDHYGKRSASMDQRYFLNDEPEVVRNILNHYVPVAVSNQLMLLAHTDTPALGTTEYGEIFESQWNEWIEIPQMEQTVVRVKIQSQKNFIGKIRSMVYKDISYMIEYQTADGENYTYHYDPALATEGLWCAPFIQWPCDSVMEAPVVRFRLSTDNQKYVKRTIHLQFEYLKLTGRHHLLLGKEQ